jgi:hypothetical protein
MATVKRTPSAALATCGEAAGVGARQAPPHLLRCLVVSLSAERRRLIRAAAEAQAWDAIVCRDAGEFLREAFKRIMPLFVIDMPPEGSTGYWDLREAVDQASQANQSLLAVSGSSTRSGEEVWARSLGAWACLNDACTQRGFEVVLDEARSVVMQQSSLLDARPIGSAPQDHW